MNEATKEKRKRRVFISLTLAECGLLEVYARGQRDLLAASARKILLDFLEGKLVRKTLPTL